MQANDRDGQMVLVQPHRARWLYVKIIHEPLYQEREGQTTKPTGKEAVDSVRYEALVKTVSLLRDGELTPGDARDLLKRGWGLRLHQRSEESIAAVVRGAVGVPAMIASNAADDEAQDAERLMAGLEKPAQPAIMDPMTGWLHEGEDRVATSVCSSRERTRSTTW